MGHFLTLRRQKLGLAFIGVICGILAFTLFLILGSRLIEAIVFGILILWAATGLIFRKYARQN